MKIFFDTEFIEDGRTIALISIGLVREDGAALYLENSACDLSRADAWVKANVFPSLSGVKTNPRDMALQIAVFAGEHPEFWAYFADYDWVVLCRLWGRMLDLPPHFPKWCRDLKQEMDRLGLKREDIPAFAHTEHNALHDALWVKHAYEYVWSAEHGAGP